MKISLRRMLAAMALLCVTLAYVGHEYREVQAAPDIGDAYLGSVVILLAGSSGLGGTVAILSRRFWLGIVVTVALFLLAYYLLLLF